MQNTSSFLYSTHVSNVSPLEKPILPADPAAAQDLLTHLADENKQLRWRVEHLEKQLYGPSSEQSHSVFSQEQALLSLFPAPPEPPATQGVVIPELPPASAPARPPSLPQARNLETQVQRLEPQEKLCPHCGKEKCEIGCEKSERFEYVPARIIRHEIHRPKLACSCGQGGVSIAPLPATPVEKGHPGPGLLAQVALSKYVDHLPLYRQEQQFARLGVHLPRQTLADWIEQCALLLQPLVKAMKLDLLSGGYVQADETPVRLMDPEVRGRCATAYLWVMGRPGGDVVFEFYPGRGKEHAVALLGDFKGSLQSDAYGVYGSLAAERPAIELHGCWSHCRRKYVDAVEQAPTEAAWVVREIARLYAIESRARAEAMNPEQRQQLRATLAPPILEGLRRQLDAWLPQQLPQSPLGKAIRYTINQWEVLQRYLKDGRIEIDTNLLENAIRPSGVGKRNYLFIGHPDAGWRSAVIYSVVVSCQRRGIDPWQYLKDVFARLPGATTSQLESFLPKNWRAAANESG